MVFSERQEHIVLLGYGGEQRLRQGSTTWPCGKGGCVFMAIAACTMESTLSSAVAFALTRDRLLETAMAMGGYQQKPKGWEENVTQAHGWCPPGNPVANSLLTALKQTIAMAGQLSGYGRGLLDRLQFDDQIYRLMVAMLLLEIRQDKTLDRLLHRQRQGRDSFDELIDYIRQTLGEPLTLSDLESRSHYSRRALQYAFAERMGCTATKWIKMQRLDRARQRLERPNLNDTVGSIARECGYRSLGLFSVDFQQRFHVKPSRLWSGPSTEGVRRLGSDLGLIPLVGGLQGRFEQVGGQIGEGATLDVAALHKGLIGVVGDGDRDAHRPQEGTGFGVASHGSNGGASSALSPMAWSADRRFTVSRSPSGVQMPVMDGGRLTLLRSAAGGLRRQCRPASLCANCTFLKSG